MTESTLLTGERPAAPVSAASGPRRKVLVFLDYDMLIRHFIHSGAFRELEAAHDVKFVFHCDPDSPKRGINTDTATLGLDNYVDFTLPRRRMGRWDMLYGPTVLYRQRGTESYQTRLELTYATRDAKQARRYEILSNPLIYPFFRAAYSTWMGVYKPLQDFIAAEQPDIVLHPTLLQGYFINELVPICRKLDIPLVCLMNSWDNPGSKVAATGHPDKLVVWGEQTRRHAVELMQMPPEDVLTFGAAQFQLYRKPLTESDAELRAQFGVPEGLPILLYGGTSKGVLENNHLLAIEAAIEEGRVPPCHILYRPHPWRGGLLDGEKSFFDYTFKHVTMDPHMQPYYSRIVEKPDSGFAMADYDVTRRLLHLVDGVMSPLSTILLEAVLLQKPVQIIMAADFVDESAASVGALISRIPHFADFQGPGVTQCWKTEDIAAGCATLLAQSKDPEIKAALKSLGDFFVVTDGPTYGERLRDLVNEMVA